MVTVSEMFPADMVICACSAVGEKYTRGAGRTKTIGLDVTVSIFTGDVRFLRYSDKAFASENVYESMLEQSAAVAV